MTVVARMLSAVGFDAFHGFAAKLELGLALEGDAGSEKGSSWADCQARPPSSPAAQVESDAVLSNFLSRKGIGDRCRSVGQTLLSCFLSGLRKFGWTEGRDFKLEVHWTEGIVDRYSQFAAELVRLNPDLIVATSTPGALAAQRATTRIPVFLWL